MSSFQFFPKIALMLTCLLPSFSVYADDLLIGRHIFDFAPYYMTEQGQDTGLLIELVDEIAKQLGHTTRYKKYSWKGLLEAAKFGEIDIALGLYKTKRRAKYLDFIESGLAPSEYGFFGRKNLKLKYDGTLDIFKGYTFGGVKRQHIVPELVDNDEFIYKQYKDNEELAQMLYDADYRIGIANWYAIAYYAGRGNFLDTIEFYLPAKKQDIFNAGFSKIKDRKELAKQFNDKIIEMKEKGLYQKVLKKYFLDKTPVSNPKFPLQ